MPLGATPCPSQASLPSLRELDMEGCAVAEEDAYRETVFEMLPQIKYLDGVDGDGEEKDEEEEDEEEEDDDDDEEADEDVDSLLDEEGSELGGDSELGEEAQHMSPYLPHISPRLSGGAVLTSRTRTHTSHSAHAHPPLLWPHSAPLPPTPISTIGGRSSHLSSQRAVCVQGADESDLGEGESELGEEEGEEGESELGDEEGEEGVSEADGEEDGGSDAGEGSAKRQRR